MKEMFFEHLMNESGRKKVVLEDSIIILDTNALLNLYRLSSSNRRKYFDILEQVEERIFLTNHSVKEFFENRLNIFRNKLSLKENLKIHLEDSFKNIENQVLNSNFKGKNSESCNLIKYEQKLRSDIAEIINKNIKEINDAIDSYKIDIIDEKNSSKDEILDKILELFDKKVNEPFSDEELNKIYNEGKQRYENKIPPGYADKGKDDIKCFGDLIIWKEILKISKREGKNILFVSDDRKEDWCVKFNGDDLGPRKELIRELYELSGKLFYSVTTTDFIRYMSEIYKINETDELQKETDQLQIQQDIMYEKASSDIQKEHFLELIDTLGHENNNFHNILTTKEMFLNNAQPKGLVNQWLSNSNNKKWTRRMLELDNIEDEYNKELARRMLRLDYIKEKSLSNQWLKNVNRSNILSGFEDNKEIEERTSEQIENLDDKKNY